MSADRRNATRVLVGIVASLFAAIVGFFAFMWMIRSAGTSCSVDEDCNSHMCLLDWRGEGVCTEICHEDEDCPSDMSCGTAYRDGPGSFAGATRERHVCLPDE